MWNLLTSLPNEMRTATPWEATVYALLGFVIVFIGIAFLIFVVWLVGKIMNKTVQPKTKKEMPTVVPMRNVKEEEELSDEVVVVIMATLTAYYEENNPKCEFTVKRIKRI